MTLFPPAQSVPQRCGLIAVMGLPNAGKSTLVNACVGEKISIVTPKVQTTRTRVLGVAHWQATQAIFVDTPGLFTRPARLLEKVMLSEAWAAPQEADLVLFVMDASAPYLWPKIERSLQRIYDNKPASCVVAIVLNKVDLVSPKTLLLDFAARLESFNNPPVFMISAEAGDGLEDLKEYITSTLPIHPWMYPDPITTTLEDQRRACEITREHLFQALHQEIPYDITVEPEHWEEHPDGTLSIHQLVIIERASQKSIVLGKNGQLIRHVRLGAQKELRRLLKRKFVRLFIHVKVTPQWWNKAAFYKDWNLTLPQGKDKLSLEKGNKA